jgi:hypothetical protein
MRTLTALAIGFACLVPAVADAFVPTVDARSIFVTNATPTESATPPVAFQPWTASRTVLVAGLPAVGAIQISSISANVIDAFGGAGNEIPGGIVHSESVLDIGFDVVNPSVLQLVGLLDTRFGSPASNVTLSFERVAPSPAVLIAKSGIVTFDELVDVAPGSYRLRAVAIGTQTPGSKFDFTLTEISQVPALGPAAQAVLALALLGVTRAACSRATRPGRPSGRSGCR